MVQERDRTQWFCQDLHAKVLQSAVEPWQKQTHTCSTRANTRGALRARPCVNPRAPAAARDHARATAIKTAPVLGCLPRCLLRTSPDLPEPVISSGDLPVTRQCHPRATTVASPFPVLLRLIQAQIASW